MDLLASRWNNPETEILQSLRSTFSNARNDWRYIKPLLRLLNKHWKATIDALDFHLSLKDPFYLKNRAIPQLMNGKGLRSLYLYPNYGALFKLDSLREILSVGTIQELKICRVDNADSIMTQLSSLSRSLCKLRLSFCQMTQIGLESLSQFTVLTTLSIARMKIAQGCTLNYQCLGSLKTLKELCLDSCEGCLELDFVSELQQLESIEYRSDEENGEASLSSLVNLQKLSTLHISRVSFSASDTDSIFSLTQLTSLILDCRRRLVQPQLSLFPRLRHFSPRPFALDVSTRCLPALLGNAYTLWQLYLTVSHPAYHLAYCLPDRRVQLPETLTFFEIDSRFVAVERFQEWSRLPDLQILRTPWLHKMPYSVDSMFVSLKISVTNAYIPSLVPLIKQCMPNLEQLGIFSSSDDPYAESEIPALWNLPRLRNLCIIVRPATLCDDRWKAMFLDEAWQGHPLEHIGYRWMNPEQKEWPVEYLNAFQSRGVLLDHDVRMFEDVNTVYALL